MAFCIICILFLLKKINSFFIISMEVIDVDDCIKSIKLESNTILYNRIREDCRYSEDADNKNEYYFEQIPYEIGQKLNIEIYDIGGQCFLSAYVKINNHIIYTNELNFWKCENCEGVKQLTDGKMILCHAKGAHEVNANRFLIYHFYFQLDSFLKLGLLMQDISEYLYYLNDANYFFISPSNFNEAIDLIDLHSMDNLYAKNKDGIISPFYNYIYYKLFFYKYSFYRGIFYGSDESNNDLILNEETYSKIYPNKALRYELSKEEKNNNGTHIKIKIGIFNNEKKQVSSSQEFNFFICLKDYQFCDLETSMKCLKEGYYQLNNRKYSCYETCKNCDTYKKPEDANYFKNYCYSCKSEFPFYVNNEKTDDNGFIINYKSCYEKCPYHAPHLKCLDSNECVSYCPRYKTSEGNCLDYCHYNSCKYLLKNESICYNYIPSNYYIYIDDYNDTYQDNDKPIIKIKEECPDGSYDSSFKYFCIKLEEDIFHLIENPNDLIRYNNPMIKYLNTKQMIIRAYSSDKEIDDIDNNKNKKIRIDISLCEQKIKKYHNLSNAEILIIQDIFNTETQKYLYKIFTKEGEELNINVCESDDISIKEIYYNIEKEQNTTKCPSGYPYLDLNKGICLKSCDIMSFLDKSCTTDVTTEENQINNINNIKKTIESHSIDYLLDNITNGGEDIIIEEKNIKYQLSSTSNQNNNKHSNISNILLGKCDTNLKEKYNISLNISLLIFKVDAYVVDILHL